MNSVLTRDSILSRDTFAAPVGPVELALARAWATALTVDRVGRNDDFFELGGDSITAVKICAVIRRDLAVEIPTHRLIRLPTVAALARGLSSARTRPDEAALAMSNSGVRDEAASAHSQLDIEITCTAASKPSETKTGAVVLGSGNGHVPTVRALADLGLATIQVRLIKDDHQALELRRRYEIYDDSGVARCRQAIDRLATSQRVSNFLLYGNCALASICFNTALVDERVTGLALMNPRMSNQRTGIFFKLRTHLLGLRSWQRLLRGELEPLHRFRIARERLYIKDMALPGNFDEQLLSLTRSRDLHVLLVFSRNLPSLVHFRRLLRTTLKEPAANGRIHLAVLATDSHDPFVANHESSSRLNELITDWACGIWSTRTV